MTDPFIGEIRINAFRFAPKNWATCDGQTLQIQQYTALFALIGRYFGTDGKTTFNLPDLRGRVPVGYTTLSTQLGGLTMQALAAKGGAEGVSLTVAQIPPHTHGWQATNTAGNAPGAVNNFYAQAPAGVNIYTDPMSNPVALHPKIMSDVGGNQPHSNMQPFLTLNFCIALLGYFPPRPW